MVLPPLPKISWLEIILIGLFLALVYMSVVMLVLHYFGSCGFVVSFEMGKCESFNCVLFPDCLAIGGHFQFHIREPAFPFLQKRQNFDRDSIS